MMSDLLQATDDRPGATEALPAAEGAAAGPRPTLVPPPEWTRRLRGRQRARSRARATARPERQLKEVLGLAGHELRGPVASSSLGVQLAAQRLGRLLDQVAPRDARLGGQLAAVQDLLVTAETRLERLGRMVGDLLDASRPQADRLPLRPARHDLAALVRRAVEEQRQLAPTRRIHLHLPHRQEVAVWADADRLHQVVTNYLANALKYSPADRPVDVWIRARGPWARVRVRDQGPGLTAQERRRIWERFHRAAGVPVVGDAEGPGAPSLGLGLYLCKRIVEEHHGRVGVRSATGRGSTFWFALRLLPAT